MRVVAIKCPTCGADLTIDDHATRATCSYCGKPCQVQQRTMLQLPRRMTEAVTLPVARPPVRWGAALVVPVVMLVGISAFSAIMVQRSQDRAAEMSAAIQARVRSTLTAAGIPPTSDNGEPAGTWVGDGPPLRADLTGDGVDDLIGVVRYVGSDLDRMHLDAVDGTTGARIWESPSLGTYTTTYRAITARAGAVLLRGDEAGALRAFDLATGVPRWQIALGEVAEHYCADDTPDAVIVMTKDRRFHRVALADGAVTPGPERKVETRFGAAPKVAKGTPACAPLPVGGRDVADGVQRERSPRTPRLDGLYLRQRLRLDGGPDVFFGHRSPGTAVPMLVTLDGKAERWRAEVAADGALTARGDEQLVTLTAELVLAIYDPGSPAHPRLTAFERSTGRRRWDVEHVDDAHHGDPVAIAANQRVALIVDRDRVVGRRLDTGEPAFVLAHLPSTGAQGVTPAAAEAP
ncbi:MAG: PQQ-binding-like beta-propeller repeat protein [Kofleriaceae bacterium]